MLKKKTDQVKRKASLKSGFILLLCAPLALQALSVAVLLFLLSQKENLEVIQFAKSTVPAIVSLSLFLNILVVAFLASRFSKTIADRFVTLTDNVERFRRQEKLHYLQEGDDELAALDQSFHEMAAALSESIARERDLIESAASIICSIDGELIIQSINPAAQKLLGFKIPQLVGNSVLHLLAAQAQELLLETLYQVRYSASESVIELQMRTAGGAFIESFWMIKWSKDKSTWICLIQDISERKLAENMRQQIVNMVSHDIRSPLSTINLIFASLQTGGYGQLSPKAIELTQSGERACARLLTLTGDLLALDRLESGMLTLDYGEIMIDELFANVVSIMAAVAEKEKVLIKHQKSGLVVIADRERLGQILINLLANAIKFSHPQGSVYLNASVVGANIEIVVKDHGIGIEAHNLPFIFDRYRQVHSAETSGKGGSGLGLAIAKALTELHGGTISCTSEHGKGTCFYVLIPQNHF